MKILGACTWRMRLALTTLFALAIGVAMSGPAKPKTVWGSDRPLPLVTDWSQHRMMFSAPRSLVQGFNLSQEPRYVQQWLRRNAQRKQHRPMGWWPESTSLVHTDWSESMGTNASVGAGQYPAKFSFDATTASCSSDFVAFNTGLAGSASQASVVAYSNLYSGCGGTVPSTYWAYDTGGTASTSVVPSIDGSQLAFVQSQSGVANLVILKWQASTSETAGTPGVLSSTSSSSYRACSAPCMTTLAFSGNTSDLISAPYYDYGSDTLFVGDNSGKLHEFTGVFNGSPSEAGSPWPVSAGSFRLGSPVYDPATGNVFVASVFALGNGGQLTAVCATSTCAGVNNGSQTVSIGTPTKSAVLVGWITGACHSTPSSRLLTLGGPMLDSTAGRVYVFVGNDGSGHSAVYQFLTVVSSTEFSQGSCGAEATVGTGTTLSTGTPVYEGAFDNLYLTSTSGSSPTGNLYVCANTGGDATLYQVPITSNAMAASGTVVSTISTGRTICSPVTEVYTGTTDLAFVSVQSLGATLSPVNCPSNAGCLVSFSLPTTVGGSLPSGTTATLSTNGGTSGIIIDNTVTPGTLSTSQVYFSTLSGGTAVQASQALLQ